MLNYNITITYKFEKNITIFFRTRYKLHREISFIKNPQQFHVLYYYTFNYIGCMIICPLGTVAITGRP